MKHTSILLQSRFLLAGALLALAPAGLLAHDEKPKAAAHGSHEHGSKAGSGTAAGAWATISQAATKLESLIGAKQLDGVHDQTDVLLGAFKTMPEEFTSLGADKKKRLEAAIRQASAIADSLHEAADGAEQMKAEAELKKLKAALKLVEAQLPPEAIRPAGDHAERPTDDAAVIKAVLAAYKAGLEKLDVSDLPSLFTADSQIFESGGVEGTFANYLEHHIGPELDHFAEFSFRDYTVDVRIELPFAFATETYIYKIVLKEDGRVIEKKGVATSILRKTTDGWKIIQTHGSSRNLPKKS